jgi:hypothetical protein
MADSIPGLGLPIMGEARVPHKRGSESADCVFPEKLVRLRRMDRGRKSMRPEDILYWLKAIPFRPFRICLNSGRTYEIRHPEMVRVSRTTMLVFSFDGEPPDVFEKMEMVGLVLVEQIEPLETPAHA